MVLVALFAFFFVQPGHDPEPDGVPLGLVGPAAERTAKLLERDGRFDPRRYDDAEAARAAIEDREVYGAVVSGPQPQLLIASAASPQVALILQEAAGQVPGATKPPVEDVKPLDRDDPRGTTINLLAVPIAVTSILGAMLLFQMAPTLRPGARLALLAAFAVVGGLVAMLIVRVAIGALPGSFLGLTALAALAIAAVAFASAGIMNAIGPPGILVSFLLFLMLGNPASGAASAPELLPEPWGTGGQFLPPGAAATGLRNVAYFDGAALARPLLVLAAYVTAGALLVLAVRRSPPPSRSATPPAPA